MRVWIGLCLGINELNAANSIPRMTMMKKGNADMWWIIAGALLVLVVVVVLLAFFGRGTQKAEASLSACETTGGQCVDAGTCGQGKEGGTLSKLFECEDYKECCFGMKKPLTDY